VQGTLGTVMTIATIYDIDFFLNLLKIGFGQILVIEFIYIANVI